VWIGIAGAVLVAAALGFYVKRMFQTGGWALAGPAVIEASAAPAAAAAATEDAPGPAFPRTEDRAAFQSGRRLLAAGDAKGALAPLSNAARMLPNDASVAHEYGTALMQAGEQDRGLFHLERAARLAPGIVSYRMDLARALAAAGRRGPAARELEGVLQREPGHVGAAEALAGLRGQPLADESGQLPGGGVDLGGAARAPGSPRPSEGTSFTNDDLARRRGAPPETRPAAVPSPSPAG
jgi:tetratricopeptide (TPR) repeat protein